MANIVRGLSRMYGLRFKTVGKLPPTVMYVKKQENDEINRAKM